MSPLLLLLYLLPYIFCSYDENLSREYWYYNTVAYCSASNLQTWKVGSPVRDLHPSVSDIQIYENKSTDNMGFLAYNPSTNTIFLVFRGTRDFSVMNWVQDFKFFKIGFNQCPGCNVHRGFLEAYKNLQTSQIMSDLKALKFKYPSAKVIVSGHSLGGAMANFAYLDACDALGHIDLMITYGAPRVGDKMFADYFNNKDCGAEKIRVVHIRDPVPHVPPKLFGFQHAHSEVFYETDIKWTFCAEFEDPNCSEQIARLAINPIDHVTYLSFNQQIQMAKCFWF